MVIKVNSTNTGCNGTNFKAHLVKNEFYNEAIKDTKADLSYSGNLNRGIKTLRALQGISDNYPQDFIDFSRKDGKVYTKINGAIKKEYTFKETGKNDIQQAIINFAYKNNIEVRKTMSTYEPQLKQLQEQVNVLKAKLVRDLHRVLDLYK